VARGEIRRRAGSDRGAERIGGVVLAAIDRACLDRLERIVVYGDNAGSPATFPDRICADDAFPTATSADGTKVQLAKLRETAQAGLSTKRGEGRGRPWRSTMTG
jgi:hypothetical protein